MRQILPSDSRLQYMGRIDRKDPNAPVFYWAGSLVQFAFTGDQLTFLIENHIIYNGLQLGCIIDGREHVIQLDNPDCRYDIPVSGSGRHICILFKRQDSTHSFILRKIMIADDGNPEMLPPLPELKLECYGDSVTAGMSPLATIRDVYSYIGDEMQLKDYTPADDNGNHTHIAVNDATDPEYHGLDDVQ